MKILILIDSLGTGGAERSTAVFCNCLKKENIPFEILCLDKTQEGVQEQLENINVKINFIKSKNIFGQVFEISNFIKNGNFDFVHSILFRSNIRARFSKLQTSFIHVESLVNTTYSKERLTDKRVNQLTLRIYKLVDKISAKNLVDHFHSITQTVKRHYIKNLNISPERITVIPRGRPPLLECYEERITNNEKPFKLLNVARHEFQKGQIFLLKAVKLLKDEGFIFELDILGRDGAVTNELQEYINNNSLENIVHLKGFSTNISDYFLESDVFVFPSLYEGLGGALIEAQSAGLPIACNDIPVLHEVVVKDKNAKFFKSREVSTIVDALRFFLQQPEKCEEFGRASLENFKTKFIEEHNNQKLLELFKTIEAKNSASVSHGEI